MLSSKTRKDGEETRCQSAQPRLAMAVDRRGEERIRAASALCYDGQAEEAAMRALGEDPPLQNLDVLWRNEPSGACRKGVISWHAPCADESRRRMQKAAPCAGYRGERGPRDRLHAQMMRLTMRGKIRRLANRWLRNYVTPRGPGEDEEPAPGGM